MFFCFSSPEASRQKMSALVCLICFHCQHQEIWIRNKKSFALKAVEIPQSLLRLFKVECQITYVMIETTYAFNKSFQPEKL